MGDKTPPNIRLLRIVEILSKHGKPLSPTELNAELGLPKQSIHRLCNTSLKQDFLKNLNANYGHLRGSCRSHQVWDGLVSSIWGVIRILQNVSAEFGETVNLVRPEKAGMMYIDRVETNWPFRVLFAHWHPCAISLHSKRKNLSCQPAKGKARSRLLLHSTL